MLGFCRWEYKMFSRKNSIGVLQSCMQAANVPSSPTLVCGGPKD